MASPVTEIVPGLVLGGLGHLRGILDHAPDVLLPLDSLPGWVWEEGWRGEVLYYPIPDYGTLPDDVLETLVEQVLRRLRDGRRVAVFCAGGHGRTGYVAACILHRLGQLNPIAFLHQAYSPHAVETAEQEEAVIRYCQRHSGANDRGCVQELRTVRVRHVEALERDARVLEVFQTLCDRVQPQGRFLLRRSGVLPEIRLLVEAQSRELCEACIETFLDVLRERGFLDSGA